MSEVDLDRPDTYRSLDPDDMYRRVNELPDQMEDAWNIAASLELPADYKDVSGVVIAGMGGSAIGGSLLETYGAEAIPVPVNVWRNYGLPAYVGQRTLVIAASYSGNTEETLSALREARRRNAKLLAVTTGGAVGNLATEWRFPAVRFRYAAQPRATLGYLFTPLLRIMEKLGFLPDQSVDFSEALDVARRSRDALNGNVPEQHNAAKQLARAMHGKAVVVYGADYLSALARRWKTQINENSKNWAFYEEFSELNHNAIVGYEYPPNLDALVVVLNGLSYSDRINKRIDVTARLMDEYGVEHRLVDTAGKSRLAQMISLISFGDYASYYLALLNGADPTIIKPIDTLKAALAG